MRHAAEGWRNEKPAPAWARRAEADRPAERSRRYVDAKPRTRLILPHLGDGAAAFAQDATSLCRAVLLSGQGRIACRLASPEALRKGGSETGCASSLIRRSLLCRPLQHFADVRANHHRTVFAGWSPDRLLCIGLVHGMPLATVREINRNSVTTCDGSDWHSSRLSRCTGADGL